MQAHDDSLSQGDLRRFQLNPNTRLLLRFELENVKSLKLAIICLQTLTTAMQQSGLPAIAKAMQESSTANAAIAKIPISSIKKMQSDRTNSPASLFKILIYNRKTSFSQLRNFL
jgi:hypothetical protein